MGTKNPCVDICKFDKKTELCIGCLRTRAECKEWKKMKESKRSVIVDDRQRRVALLAKAK